MSDKKTWLFFIW